MAREEKKKQEEIKAKLMAFASAQKTKKVKVEDTQNG